MPTKTVTISFSDVYYDELDNEIEIDVEAEVEDSGDFLYGADADGNRGIRTREFFCESLSATRSCDGTSVDLSDATADRLADRACEIAFANESHYPKRRCA